MKDKVFLDTGGLIALVSKEEENHLLAREIFEELDRLGYEIFTTDYVLAELVNWLRCRRGYRVTEIFEFLHNLYIDDLNVIEIGRDRFSDALILMHKFREHFFSLTDCVSFVVMKELKIKDAFATDKHFRIAGFNNLLN
ncbi:MAG: PIN domain-containing protein [Patescibacteria group bacterium]